MRNVGAGLRTDGMPVGKPFGAGNDARRGVSIGSQRRLPLSEYVRRETRGGRRLVDWLVEIAAGTAEARREVVSKEGGVVEVTDRPTHRERLAAIRELWDRGMGSSIPQDKMPEPPEPERAANDDLGSLEPPSLSLEPGGLGEGGGGAA